ncbi:MAG: cytochrome c peroxidase [Casimicrobiaceae bacterium]
MRSIHPFVLALGAMVSFGATAAPDAGLGFSDAEIRRIVSHGPWPPEPQRDPSNRASGNKNAVAWGAQLFREPRLSGNGTLACSSCHRTELGFTDGLAKAKGLATVDRNTPSVANTRMQRWYGWDGASDSLWAQSLRPMVDAREMGGDVKRIAAAVRGNADLADGYRLAYGASPPADDEAVAVDVAKALAAFQETIETGRTPFDDFRDALARSDPAAAARYPVAAQRGLAIFIGKGRCDVCHVGPRFSNGEFHDVGVPFFVGPGRVDSGRHDGIRRLKASRYNLLGPFSDDRGRATAVSTRHVASEHRNFGEFKVPSLRNVARTAPYMHDGSLATLRDVVRHYSEIDEDRLHADGERILKPLQLTDVEKDDLVSFLESLSDGWP